MEKIESPQIGRSLQLLIWQRINIQSEERIQKQNVEKNNRHLKNDPGVWRERSQKEKHGKKYFIILYSSLVIKKNQIK